MRVLIVDDEPMLASTLQRLLSVDHQVDVAHSGRQGLELFLRNPHDVLLCDLTLPDLSGLALLESLHQQRPDLTRRLILMTGGALSPSEASRLARFGNRVLEKPFSPDELFEVVEQTQGRSVLARRQAAWARWGAAWTRPRTEVRGRPSARPAEQVESPPGWLPQRNASRKAQRNLSVVQSLTSNASGSSVCG